MKEIEFRVTSNLSWNFSRTGITPVRMPEKSKEAKRGRDSLENAIEELASNQLQTNEAAFQVCG